MKGEVKLSLEDFLSMKTKADAYDEIKDKKQIMQTDSIIIAAEAVRFLYHTAKLHNDHPVKHAIDKIRELLYSEEIVFKVTLNPERSMMYTQKGVSIDDVLKIET